MTQEEERRIAWIATATSTDQLRSTIRNARGKSDAVYRATFARLVQVSASDYADPIARACWEMVHTVEEIRREAGRKVWRMHRLRPNIEREGERAALEYCARHPTEGFDEVLGYGLPEFTAEAIVLRFPDSFAEDTLRTAWDRLTAEGLDPDKLRSGAES